MVDCYEIRVMPSQHRDEIKGENGPPFVLLRSNRELLASTSSLTESVLSSELTQATECWSVPSETVHENNPPQIVNVTRQPLQPITLPYAQLCFDPDRKTLVTLMEISLGGSGRRSKRLRILDAQTVRIDREDRLSMQIAAASSKSGTNSTNSSRWAEEEKVDDPILILGARNSWLEETDLDLYLLHDSDEAWRSESRRGCADALRKFLSSACSCSVLVFRRESSWESTKEPFSKIGYAMLDNEI